MSVSDEISRERKMTINVPDRFKAAKAFWIGIGEIGLTPAAVLGQARVPVTVYDGKKNLVTTAQFFALWWAVGELSPDPAAGLKIATQIDVGHRPPSTMAAYYARDYRDALTRLARFKQLCTPEELQIKISKDECFIEPMWQHAQEETPPLLTDAAFASFVELGRRGTGHDLRKPKWATCNKSLWRNQRRQNMVDHVKLFGEWRSSDEVCEIWRCEPLNVSNTKIPKNVVSRRHWFLTNDVAKASFKSVLECHPRKCG